MTSLPRQLPLPGSCTLPSRIGWAFQQVEILQAGFVGGRGKREEEEAGTTAKEFASHLVLAFFPCQMVCTLGFQGIRLAGQQDMGNASLALGIH